jgi:hypothetical protein
LPLTLIRRVRFTWSRKDRLAMLSICDHYVIRLLLFLSARHLDRFTTLSSCHLHPMQHAVVAVPCCKALRHRGHMEWTAYGPGCAPAVSMLSSRFPQICLSCLGQRQDIGGQQSISEKIVLSCIGTKYSICVRDMFGECSAA